VLGPGGSSASRTREGDAAIDDEAFVLDAMLTRDQRFALGGDG
jgi:hypothetical protein